MTEINTYTTQKSHTLQPRQQGRNPRETNEGFELLSRLHLDHSQLDNKSHLPPIILPQMPPRMRATTENSRIIMETVIIQNLIQSYFAIVKKNIADLVPKTIMAFLVNESKGIAQRELVSEIYKQGNLEELMVEDPVVSQMREQRRREIKSLRHA
jgi:dynamin 1-like protein